MCLDSAAVVERACRAQETAYIWRGRHLPMVHEVGTAGVWRLMQKTDQCYLCWSPAVSVAGLQAAWQCAERRRSRDLQPSAAECNKPADITAFDPADIDVLCLYVRLQLPDYFQSPTARCLSAAYYFLVIAVSQ